MDNKTLLSYYRKNPAQWVKNVLGKALWSKQREILDSVRDNRRTAVASCHGAGKSYLGSAAALHFLYNYPGSLVITTAPTARQVEGILWAEIREAHRQAKFPLGGTPLTKRLELGEKWYAWGFTAKEYDDSSFQGFHAPYILVIVDEAAGISEKIFQGIEALLSGGHARLLLIGNPTDPQSSFAKQFSLSTVKHFTISAYDTPNFTRFGITREDIEKNTWREKIDAQLPLERRGKWEGSLSDILPVPGLITPQWVAEKYVDWGPTNPVYLARVEAKFPTDARDSLIPWSWIIAAQHREIKPDEPKYVIADISAGKGGDDTTIGIRKGGWFRIVDSDNNFDTMVAVRKMRQQGLAHQVDAYRVDPVGVGRGVCDRLSELGCKVQEIGGASTEGIDTDMFANLRASMYWQLRTLFDPNIAGIDIDPDDVELAAQLSKIKYKLGSKDRILIESKKEMLARGMKSPDRADNAAMAYAEQNLDEDIGFVIV